MIDCFRVPLPAIGPFGTWTKMAVVVGRVEPEPVYASGTYRDSRLSACAKVVGGQGAGGLV